MSVPSSCSSSSVCGSVLSSSAMVLTSAVWRFARPQQKTGVLFTVYHCTKELINLWCIGTHVEEQ